MIAAANVVVRHDTPIKLSIQVDAIEAVRPVIVRLGGGLTAPETAWTWRNQLHQDGWDPEGNVFQLRQGDAGPRSP